MQNGELSILLKFRVGVIKKAELIDDKFKKHAMKKNNQRAISSGGKRITKNGNTISNVPTRSNIAGYYDKPKMIHKKYFNTDTVCRTTMFTKKNFNSWEKSLPFFDEVSELYRTLAPEHYNNQINEITKSPFRIGDTPFTTITVNYNNRTAFHKDKGDYSKGLGNLTVIGENVNGCYLGFPQFKIAVNVQPNDFILMNVHEWHCNTELSSGDRFSFVCYMREKMVKCNTPITIDNELMYYKGHM